MADPGAGAWKVVEKNPADTWGADAVVRQYTQNGIEDKEWSYWGGNAARGEDGKMEFEVQDYGLASSEACKNWNVHFG